LPEPDLVKLARAACHHRGIGRGSQPSLSGRERDPLTWWVGTAAWPPRATGPARSDPTAPCSTSEEPAPSGRGIPIRKTGGHYSPCPLHSAPKNLAKPPETPIPSPPSSAPLLRLHRTGAVSQFCSPRHATPPLPPRFVSGLVLRAFFFIIVGAPAPGPSQASSLSPRSPECRSRSSKTVIATTSPSGPRQQRLRR
jgi:hypothetical protein